MLYHICNNIVTIFAAGYIQPVPLCTRLSLEDSKQGTYRSSAMAIPTVNLFPFCSATCGTLYLLMSANWHQTASRLVWAPSSSSSCQLALLLSICTALFLHLASFRIVTALLSRHTTALYSRCDIAQYWVGTFSGRRRRRSTRLNRLAYNWSSTKQEYMPITTTSGSIEYLTEHRFNMAVFWNLDFTCDCDNPNKQAFFISEITYKYYTHT